MLSLSDIVKIKSELKEKYNADVHYHDVCPKPYFTLEVTNEEIGQYISDFLGKRWLKSRFSDDGLQFTVEKK